MNTVFIPPVVYLTYSHLHAIDSHKENLFSRLESNSQRVQEVALESLQQLAYHLEQGLSDYKYVNFDLLKSSGRISFDPVPVNDSIKKAVLKAKVQLFYKHYLDRLNTQKLPTLEEQERFISSEMTIYTYLMQQDVTRQAGISALSFAESSSSTDQVHANSNSEESPSLSNQSIFNSTWHHLSSIDRYKNELFTRLESDSQFVRDKNNLFTQREKDSQFVQEVALASLQQLAYCFEQSLSNCEFVNSSALIPLDPIPVNDSIRKTALKERVQLLHKNYLDRLNDQKLPTLEEQERFISNETIIYANLKRKDTINQNRMKIVFKKAANHINSIRAYIYDLFLRFGSEREFIRDETLKADAKLACYLSGHKNCSVQHPHGENRIQDFLSYEKDILFPTLTQGCSTLEERELFIESERSIFKNLQHMDVVHRVNVRESHDRNLEDDSSGRDHRRMSIDS